MFHSESRNTSTRFATFFLTNCMLHETLQHSAYRTAGMPGERSPERAASARKKSACSAQHASGFHAVVGTRVWLTWARASHSLRRSPTHMQCRNMPRDTSLLCAAGRSHSQFMYCRFIVFKDMSKSQQATWPQDSSIVTGVPSNIPGSMQQAVLPLPVSQSVGAQMGTGTLSVQPLQVCGTSQAHEPAYSARV